MMSSSAGATNFQAQLPDTFQQSWNEFQSYPENHVHTRTLSAANEATKRRLDNEETRLFSTDGTEIVVRDFTGATIEAVPKSVKDDAELQAWLGLSSRASRVPQSLAVRKDPKCRLIFIHAESGRESLKISRTMLNRICTYHQVMPSYADLLFVFGTSLEARDLTYTSFKRSLMLSRATRGLDIPSLGRSGKGYQLSYNLKAAVLKQSARGTSATETWTIRQVAVHHQFDVEQGKSLWMTTAAKDEKKYQDVTDRILRMTGKNGRLEDRGFGEAIHCFRTTLAVHLNLCHWATSEWRAYIQYLEDDTIRKTKHAIHRTVTFQADIQEYSYSPHDVQRVQHLEDKANIALMVMEGNKEIMISLVGFYADLFKHDDFDLRKQCRDDLNAFRFDVGSQIDDIRAQINRIKVLLKILADRKNLISQHLQSQVAYKMQQLTVSTTKLTAMSQREAMAMKIITVVTLLYLPATFVSTFFSTDVVKYQTDTGDTGTTSADVFMGSFSWLALQRWLEVTIPLTVLTLIAGWYAFKRSEKLADDEVAAASSQMPTQDNESKSIRTV